MGASYSLVAVLFLIFIAYAGVTQAGLEELFGIYVPFVALAVFLIGVVWRVINWARSPVPFRIPTTCGQAESLSWIKTNKVDNPHTTSGVILRMLAEIFLFRSLFRNTRMQYVEKGPKIRYGSDKWLWLASLAFHYSFLVVVLWHFRFFMDPVPYMVHLIEALDGFFEVGLPRMLLSGIILFAAAGYLFFRRMYYPNVRYISLPADYFPLFLIMAIAFTGILMRYFFKVDMVLVKELTMSFIAFAPAIPDGEIGSLYYIHTFLVFTLLAYFPFSKLMHMGGIFLSPTRNMVNNNRKVRHINPWNYPVKVHTYEEYEDENRDLLIGAGVPVDKQPEQAEAEGDNGQPS